MKYLKKSAEVLIGKAGSQNEQKLSAYGLTEHTAMLTLVTHYSDGSGEELSGICVTREHLEQIRNAIDDYFLKTDDNAATSGISLNSDVSEEELARIIAIVNQQVTKQLQKRNKEKQTQLVIDPNLVRVNQLKPTGNSGSWSAKINVLSGLSSLTINGKIELSVLGDCEKNARELLNTDFHNLVMTCIGFDKSRIPDIVQENQRPVSESGKQDNLFKNPVNSFGFKSEFSERKPAPFFRTLNELMSEVTTSKNTNGVWEAKIVYGRNGSNGLISFGDTETEAKTELYRLVERWKDQLFSHRFSGVNPDSKESRIPNIVQENQQPVNSAQETRFIPLKFDLSKVTSKKTNEGWKATIRSCNGNNIDVVSEYGNSETEAKTKLYQKLALLSADYSSDTNEAENSKYTNESDDKDATQFKLNPSRVMSMKIGVDKWEARTRLFNGIGNGLVDLVATADSEKSARKELDKKFSDFAGPMTNFIKFMSQAS